MDTPSAYAYGKLQNPSSIRLIEIKTPSLPFGIASLSLTISTFALDSAPAFDALSYTWGHPMVVHSKYYKPQVNHNPSVTVKLNGGTFLVTKTLADALHKIRTVKTTKSRYLWADAICINQNDPSEKTEQVCRMDNIYKRAERVLIWLGDADEFTDDAISAVKAISAIPPDRYSEVKEADWFTQHCVFERFGVGQQPRWQHYLGLVMLLDRPWFKRVWIIQEVVLGRNSMVICGNTVFPWEWLERTLGFLATTQWSRQVTLDSFRANENIRFFLGVYRPLLRGDLTLDLGVQAVCLQATKAGVQQHGNLALFRYLLAAFRSSEAGDPRDKIFSLLGIARKDRPPFSTHPNQLSPNYHLDVKTVYTRTAKMMLEGYGDLRFFEQVEDASHRNIGGLPSWVPDYSVPLVPNPWFGDAYRSPVFKANGDIRWCFDHQTPLDQKELQVQGLCLDTVLTTLPYSLARNVNPENDLVWGEMFHHAKNIGIAQRNSTTTKTRFEVLWRTMLVDFYDKQQPAPAVCGELIVELVAWSTARIFCSGDGDERWGMVFGKMVELLDEDSADPQASPTCDAQKFTSSFEAALPEDGYHPDYQARFTRLIYGMGPSLSHRRTVFTQDGRFAVAPMSTKTGDQIWILGGSLVPVILRRVSQGRYNLVGQAFVYGVMHGEAVAGTKELESILLV